MITGCFVGGYPISLSDGTIWTNCGYLYRRRRPYISVLSLIWLRAARDLRETLAPETRRPDPLRRHVGYMDENIKRGFREEPVCEQSAITVVQNVRGMADVLVYDCRPPLLPVSIPLQDFRHSSVDRLTAPSSLAAAPAAETPGFSGSCRERVVTLGFAGVAVEQLRDRFGGRAGVRLPITKSNQIKSNSTLLRIIAYNNISKIVIKNACNIYV